MVSSKHAHAECTLLIDGPNKNNEFRVMGTYWFDNRNIIFSILNTSNLNVFQIHSQSWIDLTKDISSLLDFLGCPPNATNEVFEAFDKQLFDVE